MEWSIVAGVCVVFGAAIIYSVGGFGFGLIAVPVLAILVDPVFSVVVTTALSLLLSSVISVRERTYVQWRHVVLMVVMSIPGYPLGLIVLSRLSVGTLQVIIGAIVVIAATAQFREMQLRVGFIGVAGSGLVSGVLATSTGMNGAPVVLAFRWLYLGVREFRASVSAVLFGSKVLALMAFGISGSVSMNSVLGIFIGTPVVVVGTLFGEKLFVSISELLIRRVVSVILVMSGVSSIVKGVVW